ncbi:MAG: ABC transporter ATP-binding protein [Flavobacteriales bacterium]|nr:ABC transporter ATP-binding protein [Flavobacteriales bacterium]
MLRAENIVKRYSGHTALDDVSIHVKPQKIFGLLGPNGAGKTSLIRIINQITGPDKGEIFIDGKSLAPYHVEQIGYLPEERGLYKKMKVGEQAVYLAQLKGLTTKDAKKRLRHWFEKFEMEGWWNKKIEDLSKGMAQKVQFITTVLHEPKILILDEPFSGFDPINAKLIREEILRLRDEGATVLLSTHNMGSVEEICDDIALIDKAKVVLSGEVKQVRQDHKKHIYRVRFKGEILGFTNALWTNYELVDKQKDDEGYNITDIKILNNSNLNELLKTILPHADIQSVVEVIPTMSEIFIETVEGKEVEIE